MNGRADAPALAMANRFGRYKPEEEKAVRKAEVVEDETLKQMKKAWKKFKFDHTTVYQMYAAALRAIKPLRCSAADVAKFSIALSEFQWDKIESTFGYGFDMKAGVFLSALINKGADSDYVIHTSHFAGKIWLLGSFNTKNIIVDGDVGACCGELMGRGSITVKGDAGDWCGVQMKGGSIMVKGSVGDKCGQEMKGGKIVVEGEIAGIGEDIVHGRIYHKGKLVLEK
jgi:hypothetical protein